MPVQQGEVQGAFRALGIEDLFGDERFATYQARARNRELMRDSWTRLTKSSPPTRSVSG